MFSREGSREEDNFSGLLTLQALEKCRCVGRMRSSCLSCGRCTIVAFRSIWRVWTTSKVCPSWARIMKWELHCYLWSVDETQVQSGTDRFMPRWEVPDSLTLEAPAVQPGDFAAESSPSKVVCVVPCYNPFFTPWCEDNTTSVNMLNISEHVDCWRILISKAFLQKVFIISPT